MQINEFNAQSVNKYQHEFSTGNDRGSTPPSIKFIMTFFLALLLSLGVKVPVKSLPLSEIEARGSLIVGVKENLRPLGFRDDQGNLQGLEIDIARRLAEELLGDSKNVQLIPVLNQNRLQLVMENQVDIVIASVSVTSSRQRLVDFSDHYFLSGVGIIVKKSNVSNDNYTNVDRWQEKIGVLANSRSIAELQYHSPNLQLVTVESYQQAYQMLEKGEIQGFAGDLSVLIGWQQEYPQYQVLPRIWGGYPLAIVLPKGRQYQSLRDEVNRIVREMKADGWLKERIEYWQLNIN